MHNLLLDVIIETIDSVPSNGYRTSLNGFISQTTHSFAGHLITIEICVEQQFIHHREEYAMILLYIEKDDVFEFADRLGGIAIEDVPSAPIEDVILDESIIGIRFDRFYLIEYLGKFVFPKLISGIDDKALKDVRILNRHQNLAISLAGHISIFI